MKGAIYAIGNEILEGSIVDTNSAYIAKVLSDFGIKIMEIKALPDDKELLVHQFMYALSNYDITITTGGLGPTFDDLTAEAVSEAAGEEFVFYENVYSSIVEKLSSRGVAIKETHKRQAYLPKNATLFENKKGTAYGFGVEKDKKWIISMPGIPYEMKYMFEDYVIPFLKQQFQLKQFFKKDLKFMGIPESDVDDVITKLNKPDDVEIIINVSKGMIIVRLRSYNYENLVLLADSLKKELRSFYFGEDDDTIESVVLRKLFERGYTVATAESCTGGLIAKKITDIPGSSKTFKGSVVAYSNEIKERLLNVQSETLEKFGAVSEECCKEMVYGCYEQFKTDVAIATTGIAGPDGGSKDKPVGTIFIGVKIKDDLLINKYQFSGDRDTVRERTANMAFKLLLEKLKED
ncbi:competence/damage-inducible protein A [Deferribacter autotrophicus]|uniref:CinA-like protein n=1 Tax=Deferribacter autotrophicus TaxID=500465 RepID=A0A5A8F4D4_9BACT|nr:competence/damage-inducible protein A [Deferribacter autotrophicus]KAA0258896.1 competence/damage-inducible protein A [Deferribacter autotrophicus]